MLYNRYFIIILNLFLLCACEKDTAPLELVMLIEQGGTAYPMERGEDHDDFHSYTLTVRYKYDQGKTVRIIAYPATDYKFTGWSGAFTSADNPAQFIMDSDKIIKAHFSKSTIENDSINNLPVEIGCDTGSGREDAIYLAANGITIKAHEWAQPGDYGEINGKVYTVVSERCLRDMVNNDEDVSQTVTSLIENMSNLFLEKSDFNQDISHWDVSNTRTLAGMFAYTQAFNQDISAWDVSHVNNMGGTFSHAISFNQDLSAWDVRNVGSMRRMFNSATSFNGDISSWNVSKVQNMSGMFQDAISFNQDLTSWTPLMVIDMSYMFAGAVSFNQDISSWDVSYVRDMPNMFAGASSFNQDLSLWNVPSVYHCQNFALDTPNWTLPKPNFTKCTP